MSDRRSKPSKPSKRPTSPMLASSSDGSEAGVDSSRLGNALFQPVDVASLAAFRILFGGLLLWEAYRYLGSGWLQTVFSDSAFHFTYAGFRWVKPLPGDGMTMLFLALGGLAACVAVGLAFRTACLLLSAGWAYVLLIEKSEYLNHQYLICLLTFLMTFSGAQRAWSFAARRANPQWPAVVPAWCLWLLRFQIALPYLFGGLAKLNGDWLHGLPMQLWMSRMIAIRDLVPFFTSHGAALAMSYGGLLLDLLVVPLLLWKPARPWAFAAAVGFHLFNAAMFRIGVFPWLMIAATTLFFSPSWPRRFVDRIAKRGERPRIAAAIPAGSTPSQRQFIVAAIALWVVVQIAVPLRHVLYPGNVAWTEEGARFSWRMMLTDKTAALRITAVDRDSGQQFVIDPRMHLTSPKQIERMTQYPDMLHEFCRHIARELAASGHPHASVSALDLVSLNGRPPQPLVDPHVDLANEPVRPFRHAKWIQPLREPRPAIPWEPPPEWRMNRGAGSVAE